VAVGGLSARTDPALASGRRRRTPITVDITADQFVTEISEKVIVAENSAWHTTTWRVEDQEDKEGETDPGVSSDYRAILAEFDRAE
jgi:hypothetical protein